MTAKTPTQLITSFETGDTPTQNDYQDLLDSYVNVAQTTAQTINSDFTVNGAVSISGTVSANAVHSTLFTAPMNVTVTTSVNAVGTVQASARAITTDIVRVVISSAGTNDGIILPITNAGRHIFITNAAPQNLKVYPPSGLTINQLSANTAFVVSANSAFSFFGFSNVGYYTNR